MSSGDSKAKTVDFDLGQYTLQLPSGRDGSPDTVSGPALTSYDSLYFRHDPSKLTFWAPDDGVHTANSVYPRSELAENRSWRLADGPSVLDATLSVDQAPPDGKIVVGQIHERDRADGGPPRPPVELEWRDGQVVALVRTSDAPGGRQKEIVIDRDVPIGREFSYQMSVGADRRLHVTVDGHEKTILLDRSFDAANLYFKAGAYVQDNVGGARDGGLVSFYGLGIRH